MKKRNTRLLLGAALCLLLAACQFQDPPAAEEPPSPIPVAGPVLTPVEPAAQPLTLNRLAVEVVIDWADTDRILSCLDDLARLLGEALDEKACLVDEITVTIGTAGGITAQALSDGGIDVAFLPETGLSGLEGQAETLLESPSSGIAAAIAAAGELEALHAVLPDALMATDAGQQFLETCYPGAAFAAVERNSSEN